MNHAAVPRSVPAAWSGALPLTMAWTMPTHLALVRFAPGRRLAVVRVVFAALALAAGLVGLGSPAEAAPPPAELRADTRALVGVDARTRALVLTEMRDFLFAVNQILTGVANDDRVTVAKAARFVGLSHFATREDTGALPVYKAAAAPMEFRQMGARMHATFDLIAETAEQGGELRRITLQLADGTSQCIACHARYRFPALELERQTTLPPSVMNPPRQ